MKSFTFNVQHITEAFFEGTITINAKDEKRAVVLLTNLTKDKIIELCSDWIISHFTEEIGEI